MQCSMHVLSVGKGWPCDCDDAHWLKPLQAALYVSAVLHHSCS